MDHKNDPPPGSQQWHNELVGHIPSKFGEMTSLRNVGLRHNALQGQIPSELGNLTQLKTIEMQHNVLKGALPTQLGNLESLGRFFNFCLLSVSLPTLQNLTTHAFVPRTTGPRRDNLDRNYAGRSKKATPTEHFTGRLPIRT